MSTAQYWTPQEDEIMRQHYPTSSNAEIEALLPGRRLHGIKIRASRLGLLKALPYHEMGMPLTESVIGHLSETEKAYLAGIIDGEGCITINRRVAKGRAPVYALYVGIATTSPALKQWLEEHFPERVYIRKMTKMREHHRQSYEFVLSGNRQVIVFLREIAPYLIIKRDQAELVAQGYVHLPEEERYALWQKLRAIKKTA